MTDAVASVAPSPALPPALTRDSSPSSSTAPAAAAPAPADPAPKAAAPEDQRKPLTVNVQNDSGIFVYTLCDPVTDKVLAVIPDNAVNATSQGRHVDRKV